MRDLVILFFHFLATKARLLGSGRVRSVVAESLLVKYQLLIVNRSRQRAPNLPASDRVITGRLALWACPSRFAPLSHCAEGVEPVRLSPSYVPAKVPYAFLPNRRRKPDPKGPNAELIHADVEIKQRNPRRGVRESLNRSSGPSTCQSTKTWSRILAHRNLPGPGSGWHSRLTLLGHMKDSLEYRSVSLRVGQVEDPLGPGRHGSIQAPDHCFGVHAGVSRWGRTLSHFNRAVRGHRGLPKYLSSDHDPLYSFTNGKPICGSWRREKSRASPTFPCRELTLRRETARFAKRTAMKNSNSE
jgi:hypothetical protein